MLPKLFIDSGHTYETLEHLNMEQIGFILGYLSESGRANEHLSKVRKQLGK